MPRLRVFGIFKKTKFWHSLLQGLQAIFKFEKIYPGEEFLVLENPLREKFTTPCQYIYPCPRDKECLDVFCFECASRNPAFLLKAKSSMAWFVFWHICQRFRVPTFWIPVLRLYAYVGTIYEQKTCRNCHQIQPKNAISWNEKTFFTLHGVYPHFIPFLIWECIRFSPHPMLDPPVQCNTLLFSPLLSFVFLSSRGKQ